MADDRIPPLHWRPRKFIAFLGAILTLTNVFYSLSIFLIAPSSTLALTLYASYAAVSLLFLSSVVFWISRLKFVAAGFAFYLGASIVQLCIWAYVGSYNTLGRQSEMWTYISVGPCFLAAVLSAFTLRTAKSQVYQIYTSIERMIELGFIDPKKHEFVWSHALTTYPRFGRIPACCQSWMKKRDQYCLGALWW